MNKYQMASLSRKMTKSHLLSKFRSSRFWCDDVRYSTIMLKNADSGTRFCLNVDNENRAQVGVCFEFNEEEFPLAYFQAGTYYDINKFLDDYLEQSTEDLMFEFAYKPS